MSVRLTTDVSSALAGLDAFAERCMAQARAGLTAVAGEAETAMHNTTAHGDRTGATRAGYRAYVVGMGASGSAVIGEAVAQVEAKNPGHSATSTGTIGAQSFAIILTCPTDYQEKLETQQAGEKAVLTPTFAAFVDEFTARAAEGS